MIMVKPKPRKTYVEANTSSGSENEYEDASSDEETIVKPKSQKASVEASTSSGGENEYEYDSSDEEDVRNTVGHIPMRWYDDYPHLGYDVDGNKILKPKQGDELDNFLKRMENPNFWKTVRDKLTGQDVVLSDEDVQLISRLQSSSIPDANYDMYEPWVDFFSREVMEMPLSGRPEHKRSFLPSKTEQQQVSRMTHSIKMGWMKVTKKKKKDEGQKFYMLWDSNDNSEEMRRIHNHVPAPKMKLPGHAESYNPPPEYMFSHKEKSMWEKHFVNEEGYKRKYDFVPQKYDCLRNVPSYPNFIKDRFERCLDLYLAPRTRKMRLLIEPEDLVPELPKPRDLQPFPVFLAKVFRGHRNVIRSIAVESSGQYLASGCDDHTVKVWEVATGRCLKTFNIENKVTCVSWCPNSAVCLLGIASSNKVLILNPGVGSKDVISSTDTLLKQGEDALNKGFDVPERVKSAVTWENPTEEQWSWGVRVILNHFKPVKQVTWHAKGDYFASVMPEGQNRSVLIHQLSKRRSQQPFNKSKGLIQQVLFHPLRPYFFVATQKYVRVYNLVKQELTKKLQTGVKWISSIAVHPAGDNVIVGTYDRRLQWFDLDLSTQPYQILRHHKRGIRSVAFHRRYPLFASASDDGTVVVYHGQVYDDLLKNPLIVPVKVLRGHGIYNDFGVTDICFHPHQPWVFSSGADSTIRLYCS